MINVGKANDRIDLLMFAQLIAPVGCEMLRQTIYRFETISEEKGFWTTN
jgi:hypothetical protein